MKAGIVIDDWKLPTFEKGLKDANHNFATCKGPTPGLISITIELEIMTPEFGKLVKLLNDRAALNRQQHR